MTPTLNAAEYLDDCIASVRAQGSPHEVEHLILDDGSTDGTQELAQGGGCRLVEGDRAGLYAAMNKGTEQALGRIVSVLGADDLLLPGAVNAAKKVLVNGKAKWAVGGLQWIGPSGERLGYIGPPPAWMTVEMYASLGWSCVHHQSTFMTRDFFEEVGGYDASFRVAGDYDFFARALAVDRFAPVHRPLAAFRRHGANLSMSAATDAENTLVARRYGPAGRGRRAVDRTVLKTWLNARNPQWSLLKVRARLRRN